MAKVFNVTADCKPDKHDYDVVLLDFQAFDDAKYGNIFRFLLLTPF